MSITQLSEIVYNIPEVPRLPAPVERIAKNIENQFPVTIEALVDTAKALEARAYDLRQKAEYLEKQRIIAQDLRDIVRYEREAWEETVSLALVQPRGREEA